MPWSPSDSDRFKSGLSPEGKKKWASIANSVLAQCKKEGGKDCEGRAIRVANGSVKESDFLQKTPFVFSMKESRITDFGSAEIIIEEANKGAGSKQEMMVTLLREGPGNKFHNNYYTRSALESALAHVKSRPKQYYNHAKDVDNPDRDLRDWASSIMEAWIDTSEPKAKLKARVKVLDNWLWERAKLAPEQLAVSIEGKGSGKPEIIDGSEFNAIHEIAHVNGVNWVDYPGNAGMGVEVLEGAKKVPDQKLNYSKKQEDTKMSVKDILESLKDLSQTELAEVVKERPDLKEFFMFGPPEQDEKTKGDIAALSEQMKAIKESSEKQSKELQDKVIALEQEKNRLVSQVEAHALKEKENDKANMIDTAIAGSKLKKEHVTETFMNTLKGVREYKSGEKTITESDQVKTLIEDREKICIGSVASGTQPGGGIGGDDLTEQEKSRKFTKNIFNVFIN